MNLSTAELLLTWGVFFPLAVVSLCAVIYFYYKAHKVLTAKCQICGKKVKGQVGKKVSFIYTPWSKPKFICFSCQKKKKNSCVYLAWRTKR